MCIIIPIDHTPCDHTVAIWQHCANAPRSVFGHKPCSHIRQHARPIITRKMCRECGGPRYFARRGGLAARGSGSGSDFSMLGQVKEDLNEQYDSGYQSDLIPEADDEVDDDDSSLSPRQSAALTQRWMDISRQRSSNIPRSSGQRSNWRPNLKRDLSGSSSDSSVPSLRRPSIVSTRQLPHGDTRKFDNNLVPIIRSPSPPRKGSTLLHPSSPLQELFEPLPRASTSSFQDLTPPATPPSRPDAPKRQSSTLLHPSSPQVESVADGPEELGSPFKFSLPAPVTSAPIPTSAPRRPNAPSRKKSTLLHPSPPNEEMTDPFPVIAKTVISLPPTPQATPTLGCFKRCPSVRSNLSGYEWEEPLHSSHSDVEYDSDDDDDQSMDADMTAHSVSIKVAHLCRTARASRISFHGNQLRILRD
ncbi:hypothetical protein PMIN01_09944 [Paraphaeosphaeria minitans]|uniref:Uncharacterized protein n=1 Tax=Paraphaeosphaeria minitans TaxID=565426 RepID=A0A9P6GBI9_9PLEO|nr:hypothetical protein PMIN01_09944 [Paraphaeosphaeria minitans]